MAYKLFRITTVPLSLKVLLKGQLRFMAERGYEVIGISTSGKEVAEVCEQEGIRVETVPMTRKITPLRDLKSLWHFYYLCKNEKPILVHSHTPKAGIIGMLGAKIAGVPIRLHTVAGLPLMEISGPKRYVLNLVEKLTYACATKVYPNSKGLFDFILAQGFTKRNKLKVIGHGSTNGVDTAYFNASVVSETQKHHLRHELGIQENDYVFIFVGRLVGDKGINELVTAFSEIAQVQLPNIDPKLLLVGPLESELDPLLPETIKEIESNPQIICVGFQEDVRPYYAVSNCLAFPSYREGFPNVVMQAGAMGLPCIVSNINGCNEIIREGVNGTLIPAKDIESIVSAMKKLMNNKEYYHHLKNNARSLIKSRFEQKMIWNYISEEYGNVIRSWQKSLAYTKQFKSYKQ